MESLKFLSKIVSKPKGTSFNPRNIKKLNKRKCMCCVTIVPNNTPSTWAQLRSERKLCDGIIKTSDGTVFYIHRIVLSSVSRYFEECFTNCLKSSESEIKELIIDDVPSYLVGKVIDYAYTGSCHITEENVCSIIPVADQFDCIGLLYICYKCLLNYLTPENCLGIHKFVQYYFCKDVENQTLRYICYNFTKINNSSEDFFELSVKELGKILGDDKLNVKDEMITFQAIERWIDKDPQERRRYYSELLECVRFRNMDKAYFNNVIRNHKYNNDKTKQVLQIAEVIITGTKQFEHKFSRPRTPFEILFAVGGWTTGSPTNFIETYDSRANQWFVSGCTDKKPRAYHGVVLLNNLMYVIGGFDGTDYFNTVRCFDPETLTWSERSCMYHARCYVSVCTLDGNVYAMGGFNGHSRMTSVEKYDSALNQWELISSMNKPRSDASAASLNNMIYIAGGFSGQEVMCSVEVYNHCAQKWTFVSNMMSCRSGVSLVAHSGVLYALGGYNGTLRLDSGEKYDPKKGQWEPIANMLIPRSNFASVILDNMVYVIGGYNGTTTISNTECYNTNYNEWHAVTGMNLNRSALAACVCKNLPNAKDYSYLSRNVNYSRQPDTSGDSHHVHCVQEPWE